MIEDDDRMQQAVKWMLDSQQVDAGPERKRKRSGTGSNQPRDPEIEVSQSTYLFEKSMHQ